LTNENAAETIGKSWHIRKTSGESYGADNFNLSSGQNESFDYDVPPQTFTKLRKGGHPNNKIVEAIIFQNGRLWNNNKTYLPTQFKQYEP